MDGLEHLAEGVKPMKPKGHKKNCGCVVCRKKKRKSRKRRRR